MTQISSTFSATRLTPRTANYVAALIREGDNFDYCRWLHQVREEKAQAKEYPQTVFRRSVPEKIETRVAGGEASLNGRLFNRRAPIPIAMTRSRRQTLHSTSVTRTARRLERVKDAWNNFQASRARDAVYGYLEAVFAIVKHYRVRQRIKKLLQHAFKFAVLPFDKDADPFAAIIRCTCGHAADNKTISKWARALRYVALYKAPSTQLRMFMKQAGGVNACGDSYASYLRRGTR
jgi:hypothetical protein